MCRGVFKKFEVDSTPEVSTAAEAKKSSSESESEEPKISSGCGPPETEVLDVGPGMATAGS